jgi:hypothetical protein
MDEPPITIYVQHFDKPSAERKLTSGFWRHELAWPIERSRDALLYLAENRELRGQAAIPPSTVDYSYNPTVGTTFGMFSAGSPLVTPVDQRLEEAYSTSWSTPPLTAPVEILGYPEAMIYASVSTDIAALSVRLIDVAPDGTAALITKGVLNLTHRDSHSDPSPVEPGQVYALNIQLDATSWLFAAGHSICISIAAADFPNSWPTPKMHTGTIYLGGDRASSIKLPVLDPQQPALPAPLLQPPTPYTPLVAAYSDKPIFSVTRDHIAGTAAVRVGTAGRTRVSEQVEFERSSDATATVYEHDPAHATIRGVNHVVLHWPDRTIDATARAQVESTVDTLHVTIQLNILLDGQPYHSRRWAKSVTRHLL